MRVEEITLLRWSDLNIKDRTIIIRNRKHPRQKEGNDQEVPLLGKAFEIIQRQPRPDQLTRDARIFPVKVDTITTIFPRAKKALGIHDLHFHDLRHEGVSRLFELGFQIQEVALVSGHRDWKMLARYTQIKAKDLHRPRTEENIR
jgi:integrase